MIRCAMTKIWVAAVVIVAVQGLPSQAEDKTTEDSEVKISAKCAAVLLTSSAAIGGAVAYTMTPAMLCGSAGFCPIGVSKGSMAAAWQSTMPVVAKGSMFATLQSTAMAGAGVSTTVAGAAVGGATGLLFLERFCSFVDEAEPGSYTDVMFQRNLELVQSVGWAAESASEACMSSYTCSKAAALSQSAVDAAAAAGQQLTASAGEACASSLTCSTTAGAAAAAAEHVSSAAWNTLWTVAGGMTAAAGAVADVVREVMDERPHQEGLSARVKGSFMDSCAGCRISDQEDQVVCFSCAKPDGKPNRHVVAQLSTCKMRALWNDDGQLACVVPRDDSLWGRELVGRGWCLCCASPCPCNAVTLC